MNFKKAENRIPNEQLNQVVLENLIIRSDFRTTLNLVLKRRDEILRDFNVVEIVINERNEVMKGALDVVVLRGLAKQYHSVKVLSSKDTIKSGKAIFKEMGISDVHHSKSFIELFQVAPKKKG
jgi:hypothetical protein